MLQYYYANTIETIRDALLAQFNNMVVFKYDSSGVVIGEKQVPITFGAVEKHHQDRIENHTFNSDNVEHNQTYNIQIPRLALTHNGIAYDANRAIAVESTRTWFNESLQIPDNIARTVLKDFQPIPYNFNFTLNLLNDNFSFYSQIMENILPYFNPALMIRVKEFSFLNIERDLKVTMDGINYDFSDEIDENETRKLNASMNLTVEGFIYKKWVTNNIIKTINARFLNLSPVAIIDRFKVESFEIGTSAIRPTTYYTSGSLDKTGDGISDIEYYSTKLSATS